MHLKRRITEASNLGEVVWALSRRIWQRHSFRIRPLAAKP